MGDASPRTAFAPIPGAALLALALLLPGCAARFAGGELPDAGLVRTAAPSHTVATYWMADPLEPVFQRVLEESGRFAVVKPLEVTRCMSPQEADLHLDVRIMHSSRTRHTTATLLHQIACGITLAAIPYWGTDATQVVVHVSPRHGPSREYVLEDRLTLVAWLPMVAVTLPRMAARPFLGSVEERFYENLFRNLVARMERDGLLASGA